MTPSVENQEGFAWTWLAPPILKRKRSEEAVNNHSIPSSSTLSQQAEGDELPPRFAKYYRFTSEDLQEIFRDAAAEGRR